MHTTNDQTCDIEQASKACGLSPGVLRMWELRYGWPRPGRLPNGYRYFSAYQIEELRRMAALVKTGMLISKLIDNGMPKWPGDGKDKPRAYLLQATRALPEPAHENARDIRARLIDALQARNGSKAWEMLLRCAWEVHPSEQAVAGWLPCITALDEARHAGKTVANSDQLEMYVRDHIKGALGRLPQDDRPLWIVPTAGTATCAAYVAALIISQRGGGQSRPWLWDKLPVGPFITVGPTPTMKYPGDQHQNHVAIIGGKDVPGLTSLLPEVKRPVAAN